VPYVVIWFLSFCSWIIRDVGAKLNILIAVVNIPCRIFLLLVFVNDRIRDWCGVLLMVVGEMSGVLGVPGLLQECDVPLRTTEILVAGWLLLVFVRWRIGDTDGVGEISFSPSVL
jgi:hypothetical protein